MAGTAFRVAYLGPKGSFTHQAALQLFPKEHVQALVDFPAIFQAVTDGTIDRGVVPVENSTNGFVMPILDLLAKQQYSVSIIAETHVAVQQALLGHRNSGAVDEDYSHIKTLWSHPQAWGQCEPLLTRYFRGVTREDATSTSRAAEIVAQDASRSSAAICSPLAAELYGLDVLIPHMEQKSDNTTRFVVLANSNTIDGSLFIAASTEDTAPYKTLVSFTINHTQPASLANALSVFGKHGINLTSLSSRPQSEQRWQYIFFIEFRGRKGEAEVDAMLEEFAELVQSWKWIGSWRSNGDGG